MRFLLIKNSFLSRPLNNITWGVDSVVYIHVEYQIIHTKSIEVVSVVYITGGHCPILKVKSSCLDLISLILIFVFASKLQVESNDFCRMLKDRTGTL